MPQHVKSSQWTERSYSSDKVQTWMLQKCTMTKGLYNTAEDVQRNQRSVFMRHFLLYLCTHYFKCETQTVIGNKSLQKHLPRRRWVLQPDGLSQWEFWVGGSADIYTPSYGQTMLVSAGDRHFNKLTNTHIHVHMPMHTIPGKWYCSSEPSCTGNTSTRSHT